VQISLKMRSLMWRSRSESGNCWKKRAAADTESAVTAAMFWPAMVTARLSGLRRLPWHSGQGRVAMYRSNSCLTYSELVSW
jgi:hypothetical protein